MTNLTDLKTAAEVILYLNKRYPKILPPTTVKLLKSGIKNDDIDKLVLAIRRAGLHSDMIQKEINTDAQIEQLIEEETEIELMEAEIEAKKLETIALYTFLEQNRDYIHTSKQQRFDDFLEELELLLAGNNVSQSELDDVDAWLKRANDFKAGIDHKLRQAPQQTRRTLVAA